MDQHCFAKCDWKNVQKHSRTTPNSPTSELLELANSTGRTPYAFAIEKEWVKLRLSP
jgi:hypothetical protein